MGKMTKPADEANPQDADIAVANDYPYDLPGVTRGEMGEYEISARYMLLMVNGKQVLWK